MNKMDFFLRDHNLNSAIIYLLLSLGFILFTLGISVLLGKASDKKASMVFSNLGRLNPPAEVGEYIDNYSTFCSSENLFATMSTYNGDLTLGVTSPYLGTNVVRNFVRTLSRSDVNIRVYATEVIGL